MAVAPSEALIGRTIAGKYAVEALLGSGAMGAVYRARQIALEKTVALKVMHEDIAADPAFATRFHREAKAASRLDHPNSIRVIDFGEEPDGLTYIAMEYAEGRDLLNVIQTEWPLSAARIGGILMQVLSALAVAHEMGVVHRDLKPENIMILSGKDDEGQTGDVVKVCDFGIAKITAKSHLKTNGPSTTQGVFVGTPEYVSPEQGKGDAIDARSDLYSVGVILFQLLTGKLPFEADNPIGVVLKHVTDEPPVPSSINPAIDRRLEAICLKAMRKRLDERFQTAREMRSEIRAAIDGTPSGAMGRGSGATPTPAPFTPMAPPEAAHADTLQASSIGTPRETTNVAATSDTLAAPGVRATRSRRMALAMIGVIAALGGMGLVFALRSTPPAVGPGGAVAGGLPAAVAASAATTRSAPDPGAIVPAVPQIAVSDPPAASEPAAPSAAERAAAGPLSAGASSATRTAPSHPGAALAGGSQRVASTSSPGARVETPTDDGAPSFNLATAGAVVTVTKARGAEASAVQKVLPGWAFTDCYRAGLKHAKKRLDGRTILQLTFAPSGVFLNVKGITSNADLSGVAQCVFKATLASNPIAGADAAGGTAEAIVTFSPE